MGGGHTPGGWAESIINPIPTAQANRGHVSAALQHGSMEAFRAAVPRVRARPCGGRGWWGWGAASIYICAHSSAT